MIARRPHRAAWLALLAWAALPAQAEDWQPGEKLTYINCGRCHVIGERNRMGGIGSTPSFKVIRSWADWEDKMRGFYTLRPHPAFTQIDGVTEPFTDSHPSPIHPISLTEAEVETILDYARELEPADLGAPIR